MSKFEDQVICHRMTKKHCLEFHQVSKSCLVGTYSSDSWLPHQHRCSVAGRKEGVIQGGNFEII